MSRPGRVSAAARGSASALGHPGASLVFAAPLPPTLTNSGRGRSRHWRAAHKEKLGYWATLDLLAAARKLPRPPASPLEHAEATATLYLWNPMDDGNALARLKWLEDWLVTRGYLRDDRRKCLRWTGLPEQVIARGDHNRVELTLSPVEPCK